MVYHSRSLDRTFAALADPTRRAILARLTQGEIPISQLARPFSMSLPAVSKHLRVLQRAGLATIRRDGRSRQCRLVAAPLRGAGEWVEQYRLYWERQLDQLATYLDTTAGKEKTPWPPPAPNPPGSSKSAGSSRSRQNGSSGRGRPRRS
ncbi:MAG TPA: metalloregulator ArsR/SmtB family transcription factor [Gemmatimonadales bacterium]|nr:metalloregulator ArsR/SmtB family transcription factor [Gemmatimonadales bacterium]